MDNRVSSPFKNQAACCLVVAVIVAGISVRGARAQATPPACADGACIQIASFNIELLGNDREPYGGEDRGPRTDSELREIADLVTAKNDLEIVVFEEINTQSPQWQSLKGMLEKTGYQFFEGTSSERQQFVVLAWDADEITVVPDSLGELDVSASFNFGGGCKDSGLRRPVAGRFRAGMFDFWVVGVHLKSRRGKASCTSRMRHRQCEELVVAVDELVDASGETDVVIVGDFNENPGHESLQPLVDAGFTSQMKFRMDDSAAGSYVKNGDLHGSTDLIDQAFIRYGDTTEVVRHSAFVTKLASAAAARAHIIKISDHVPVWVSFRTDADLDGED